MTVATVQFGNHSSNSTQNHATSEARTSSLAAGKGLTIMATDGSITSQGAQMSAEGNALLLAKDSIKSGFSFDNRSALMVGTCTTRATAAA